MSEAKYKIRIEAEAELGALRQTDQLLQKQIAVARATGKEYGGLAQQLQGVQSRMREVAKSQPPPLPGSVPSSYQSLRDRMAGVAGQIPGLGRLGPVLTGTVAPLAAVAAGALAVGAAVTKAWQATRQWFASGIELNRQMEDTRRSLAVLMGQFDDQAPAAFAGRLKLAEETLDSLLKKGDVAEGTFNQLTKALTASSGGMFAGGVDSMEKQVDMVIAASQVLGAMGGDQNMLGQKLAQIFSGTADPMNELAQNLNFGKGELQKFIREGTLYEEMMRRWEPVLRDAEHGMENLSSQQTFQKENIEELQRIMSEPIFEGFKEALAEINELLGSDAAKEWAQGIADALSGTKIVLGEIAADMRDSDTFVAKAGTSIFESLKNNPLVMMQRAGMDVAGRGLGALQSIGAAERGQEDGDDVDMTAAEKKAGPLDTSAMDEGLRSLLRDRTLSRDEQLRRLRAEAERVHGAVSRGEGHGDMDFDQAQERVVELQKQIFALEDEIERERQKGRDEDDRVSQRREELELERQILEARRSGDETETRRLEWLREYQKLLEQTGGDKELAAGLADLRTARSEEEEAGGSEGRVDVSALARQGGAMAESLAAARMDNQDRELREMEKMNQRLGGIQTATEGSAEKLNDIASVYV